MNPNPPAARWARMPLRLASSVRWQRGQVHFACMLSLIVVGIAEVSATLLSDPNRTDWLMVARQSQEKRMTDIGHAEHIGTARVALKPMG